MKVVNIDINKKNRIDIGRRGDRAALEQHAVLVDVKGLVVVDEDDLGEPGVKGGRERRGKVFLGRAASLEVGHAAALHLNFPAI